MIWQGGTDGVTLRTYAEEVLVLELWDWACLVIDNFSSHHIAISSFQSLESPSSYPKGGVSFT